jgi:hypothetical protein
MYSPVKTYQPVNLKQQRMSKKLTIDSEPKTGLVELFYPLEINSHVDQAKQKECDRRLEEQNESEIGNSELADSNKSSLIHHLSQLKHDIQELELSLGKTIEAQPDSLQQRVNKGIEQLQLQSQHINDMAAQLEAELIEFKQLANQVNQDYHAIQSPNRSENSQSSSAPVDRTRPANIWEIRAAAIPNILKQGDRFILTTKQVLEVAEDNAENRVKKAQERQKALASWLEAKRQRIIEDFSRP